jgi:hypothetical protein
MTLVGSAPTDSAHWFDAQVLPRVGTVFANCAYVDPPLLAALASAFAKCLVAGQAAPSARDGALASPPRSDVLAHLGGLLRRAEQPLGRILDAARLRDEIRRLEAEAVEVLADVRAVIRDLPPDQPAVQRLRRALLRSWGRYDDALAGLRRRQDRGIGGVADLAVVARLRDVLVRSLKIVRAQSGRAALAYTSGGSVQR